MKLIDIKDQIINIEMTVEEMYELSKMVEYSLNRNTQGKIDIKKQIWKDLYMIRQSNPIHNI